MPACRRTAKIKRRARITHVKTSASADRKTFREYGIRRLSHRGEANHTWFMSRRITDNIKSALGYYRYDKSIKIPFTRRGKGQSRGLHGSVLDIIINEHERKDEKMAHLPFWIILSWASVNLRALYAVNGVSCNINVNMGGKCYQGNCSRGAKNKWDEIQTSALAEIYCDSIRNENGLRSMSCSFQRPRQIQSDTCKSEEEWCIE